MALIDQDFELICFWVAYGCFTLLSVSWSLGSLPTIFATVNLARGRQDNLKRVEKSGAGVRVAEVRQQSQQVFQTSASPPCWPMSVLGRRRERSPRRLTPLPQRSQQEIAQAKQWAHNYSKKRVACLKAFEKEIERQGAADRAKTKEAFDAYAERALRAETPAIVADAIEYQKSLETLSIALHGSLHAAQEFKQRRWAPHGDVEPFRFAPIDPANVHFAGLHYNGHVLSRDLPMHSQFVSGNMATVAPNTAPGPSVPVLGVLIPPTPELRAHQPQPNVAIPSTQENLGDMWANVASAHLPSAPAPPTPAFGGTIQPTAGPSTQIPDPSTTVTPAPSILGKRPADGPAPVASAAPSSDDIKPLYLWVRHEARAKIREWMEAFNKKANEIQKFIDSNGVDVAFNTRYTSADDETWFENLKTAMGYILDWIRDSKGQLNVDKVLDPAKLGLKGFMIDEIHFMLIMGSGFKTGPSNQILSETFRIVDQIWNLVMSDEIEDEFK